MNTSSGKKADILLTHLRKTGQDGPDCLLSCKGLSSSIAHSKTAQASMTLKVNRLTINELRSQAPSTIYSTKNTTIAIITPNKPAEDTRTDMAASSGSSLLDSDSTGVLLIPLLLGFVNLMPVIWLPFES